MCVYVRVGWCAQKGRSRGVNIVGITHVPLSQVPVAEPPAEEGEEAASGPESAPAKVRSCKSAGLQCVSPLQQNCLCIPFTEELPSIKEIETVLPRGDGAVDLNWASHPLVKGQEHIITPGVLHLTSLQNCLRVAPNMSLPSPAMHGCLVSPSRLLRMQWCPLPSPSLTLCIQSAHHLGMVPSLGACQHQQACSPSLLCHCHSQAADGSERRTIAGSISAISHTISDVASRALTPIISAVQAPSAAEASAPVGADTEVKVEALDEVRCCSEATRSVRKAVNKGSPVLGC